MTEPTPLRKRIAHAIHRYDQHHALSGNDIPSRHHYGEADYVLTELRTELDGCAALTAENDRLTAELADYEQRVEQLTDQLAALRAVARLHQQTLISSRELYAVIEADDAPAATARYVHVTVTNPDEHTANRQALSLVDWINAEFPGLMVHTDAREHPAGIDTALIHAALDQEQRGG